MDQAKIDQVIECASGSAGVPLLPAERDTLMAIAEEAGRSLRAFTSAKTALEKVTLQTYAQRMAPTVGKTTAAIIATFVGDPALFPSAAAYVKACGLNLKEKSSGKLKGHLKITKRGFGAGAAVPVAGRVPLDQDGRGRPCLVRAQSRARRWQEVQGPRGAYAQARPGSVSRRSRRSLRRRPAVRPGAVGDDRLMVFRGSHLSNQQKETTTRKAH